METGTVILGLMGFLQVIFMFMVSRAFNTLDKLHTKIETNETQLRNKIDKNADEAKEDREKLKAEHTHLLENHYVTTGQLNTLEEKLIGQIRNLATSIEHLTDAIKNNNYQNIKGK